MFDNSFFYITNLHINFSKFSPFHGICFFFSFVPYGLKLLCTQFQWAPCNTSRLQFTLSLNFFLFSLTSSLVQFWSACSPMKKKTFLLFLWFGCPPIFYKLPECDSSSGSNSPSAHESLFHTAFEFEFKFIGLVAVVWFVIKFGKSFGLALWSLFFCVLFRLPIISFSFDFAFDTVMSLSSRSSSFYMGAIERESNYVKSFHILGVWKIYRFFFQASPFIIIPAITNIRLSVGRRCYYWRCRLQW